MAKIPLSEKLNNTLKIAGILAISVAIVVGVLLSLFMNRGVHQTYGTISVQGEHTTTVDPEQVEITFQTIEEGKDIAVLQNDNAVKINGLKAALDNFGKEYKIETLSFNIYPEYNWVNGKQVFRANVLRQTVKITSPEVEGAGKLIDLGIKANIGIVQQVSFSLTDETEEKIRNEAQAEAVKKAKDKAEQMAKAGGFSLKGVVGLNTGGYYPRGMYALDSLAVKSEAGYGEEYIPTDIQPKSLEISASASITYRIK